ncbi:PolC-type DNA polymerase III [Mycoplasma sp. HF11B]|uniref:3'-5' exonuclease n=1 Tax=unclassified Mycoplasma TaxID=2683645 RepID=UPI003AAF4BBC
MYPNSYIVLDIETTGLSPNLHEITEIAAIKVINNQVAERFSKLVKINGPLPDFISKLTHITWDMLQNQAPIEKVMQDFIEFIQELPLIGHNIVRFDIKFLQHYAIKTQGHVFTNEIIDTLMLSRNRLRLPNYKLGTICDYYFIPYDASENHRALADCEVTLECYKFLTK